MFWWGVIFLVVTLTVAALDFNGLAGTATNTAKIVSAVGIILFLMSLLTGRRCLQVTRDASDAEA